MLGLPLGTVCFLFTDIEGSTKRCERARVPKGAALASHDALLLDARVRHGGAVLKTVGDAVCAAFAAQSALAADSSG